MSSPLHVITRISSVIFIMLGAKRHRDSFTDGVACKVNHLDSSNMLLFWCDVLLAAL